MLSSKSVKQTEKFEYGYKELRCFDRRVESIDNKNNNSTDTKEIEDNLSLDSVEETTVD